MSQTNDKIRKRYKKIGVEEDEEELQEGYVAMDGLVKEDETACVSSVTVSAISSSLQKHDMLVL